MRLPASVVICRARHIEIADDHGQDVVEVMGSKKSR
jgi:hypothetical protein